MKLLKRLSLLPAGFKRWVRNPRGTPARAARQGCDSFTLYNGGVVVSMSGTTPVIVPTIRCKIDAYPTEDLKEISIVRKGDRTFVLAAIAPSVFERVASCVVTVAGSSGSMSKTFLTGPGRYAWHIDGVRDYGFEGWVSALFPSDLPDIHLIVDGVSEAPVTPAIFRPELRHGSPQGGWNGFRLPLPARALDGLPHRIAVRAGGQTLDVGPWASRPEFHIDVTETNRFTGWFFDVAALDGATTMRIEAGGKTVAASPTHFRKDILETHRRHASGFAFVEAGLQPGGDLVAGPEGSGVAIGRITGDDQAGRINARRAEARAHLLQASDDQRGLPARRTIRSAIAGLERTRPGTRLGFRPAAATPSAESRAAAPEPRVQAKTDLPPVCAIVPAYNGLSDLKLCLASLIPELAPGRARAIVINDGSPDAEVGRYLAQLDAEAHPGLTILENPANLGFIETVNRGISLLNPDEDALLVNADTILPPGAVAKLSRHCHAQPGIATVTPMSNNATLLSFPDLKEAGLPLLGLGAAALDAAFAADGAEPIVIPTGVGFCLHINRKALYEVGPLSPEWGKGYCEEVDWCLKARDLGWAHLAATDAFVVHEGSVSFSVAKRAEILQTNHARLERLYPEYVAEIRDFFAADPLQPLRSRVLARLIGQRFTRMTLHLTHGLGGGTKRYIADLCALKRDPSHEVGIVTLADDGFGKPRVRVDLDTAGAFLTVKPDQFEALLDAIEAAGCAVLLQVNSRLNYDSGFLTTLLSGPRPYVVMLHDFQWYCPRVHLTDERNVYCGEPSVDICQSCVASGLEHDFGDQGKLIATDMRDWLAFNADILRRATRVMAPSQDTADRYARRLGIQGIAVAPHAEPPMPAPDRAPSLAPRRVALRVAVVGSIGHHKGFDLLRRVTDLAARERAPFFLTVIGITRDTTRLTRHGNAEVTGAYEPAELRARLAATDPDFVFLSSVWPETYSYVLSEVAAAGYPIVAFEIGAPADRIRESGGGLLIPLTRDAGELLAALLGARDALAGLAPMSLPLHPPPTLEAYYEGAGVGIDNPAPAAATSSVAA